MTEVLLATRNKGKVKEFQSLLDGLGLTFRTLDDFPNTAEVREDGTSFEANAIKKASEYSKATGMIAIADDSGLVVDALDGGPGVYSSRYAGDAADDDDNNEKLILAMKGFPKGRRGAAFVCVVAAARPDGSTITSEGRCEGEIISSKKGGGGFGYDPLFYIPGFGCTMAELASDKKNEISHRGKAVKKFKDRFLDFSGSP
ncbi:MAG: XTP/dITP diphosphatase [Proteobacteria bacterium]|nr:XTP/dITP diphosphatase [Pseudomonadota bacterium]